MIGTVTGRYLEYRHLICGPNKDVWKTSLANDRGWLAQGLGTRMPEVTNTVFFVPQTAIPLRPTYSRLVASIRSHKTKTYRVCVIVGGKRLEFPGNTTNNCASLTTTKCLLNSTISVLRDRFLTLDIKNFLTILLWRAMSI